METIPHDVQMVMTNGIRLAYVDYGGTGETMLLMHGLTANLRSFEGLVHHGLTDVARVIAVDLRGRGLSDKPESGYSMAIHAADILGLLDALGLERVILVGHSFGGLLSIYLAAHHPQRVTKMVIMDSGKLHPSVRDLIKPSLERLGRAVPSWEMYINAIKQSPYYADGFWTQDLEAYYRADVEFLEDGSVRARAKPHAIAEAVDGTLSEDWEAMMRECKQPSLLLRAPDPLGAAPVVTEEGANETAALLGNCRHVVVHGHHVTMMFGDHAAYLVMAIRDFLHSA